MSALSRAKRPTDFDGLYRRHAPTVYRYAYAVLGNQADAEDITQQTFLNAYRATQRGTRPRKEENWLVTIAHNELRSHFRSNGHATEVELDDRLSQPAPEVSEPRLADVVRALRRLPPTQRSALVLREFEGRPYREIAEILGTTQSALESLLFRARRALGEELEGALTCGDAEQSISRRLDRRLRRREARRLKEHLRECGACMRFETLQKRQRSALKSLSFMPIPVSLFLSRSEQAVAGLGGAAAAGSSGLTGGGIGLGGLGAGLVAKAAAVSAAVAITGGVGYGVVSEAGAPSRGKAVAGQQRFAGPRLAPPVQRVEATPAPAAAVGPVSPSRGLKAGRKRVALGRGRVNRNAAAGTPRGKAKVEVKRRGLAPPGLSQRRAKTKPAHKATRLLPVPKAKPPRRGGAKEPETPGARKRTTPKAAVPERVQGPKAEPMAKGPKAVPAPDPAPLSQPPHSRRSG